MSEGTGRWSPEAVRLAADREAASKRKMEIQQLRKDGVSIAEIARRYGISRGRARVLTVVQRKSLTDLQAKRVLRKMSGYRKATLDDGPWDISVTYEHPANPEQLGDYRFVLGVAARAAVEQALAIESLGMIQPPATVPLTVVEVKIRPTRQPSASRTEGWASVPTTPGRFGTADPARITREVDYFPYRQRRSRARTV